MTKPYYQDEWVQIFHGDCREILPELPNPDLLLTDPPYGINYSHGGENKKWATKFADVLVIGDNEPFDPLHLLSFKKVILWGANHYADTLPKSAGWMVWDKRELIHTNDQSDCELAWTNFLTTARLYRHIWSGWNRGDESKVPRVHPTQKPVGLMIWCIDKAEIDGLVIDPYMGSGTTLLAAKLLNKACIGIEIEEKYCEIAAKRCSQGVFDLASIT